MIARTCTLANNALQRTAASRPPLIAKALELQHWSNMDATQARDEAQRLVDIVKQIKSLEAQAEPLRIGLMGYVTEHGAIICTGGRVLPREHHERQMFDKARLETYMIEKMGLSPERVQRAFSECTSTRDIMPGVSVKLDANP